MSVGGSTYTLAPSKGSPSTVLPALSAKSVWLAGELREQPFCAERVPGARDEPEKQCSILLSPGASRG